MISPKEQRLVSSPHSEDTLQEDRSPTGQYAHVRAEWIRQENLPNFLVGGLFQQASVSLSVSAVVWARLAVRELAGWLSQEKGTSFAGELRPAITTLLYLTAGVWRSGDNNLHHIRSLNKLEVEFSQLGVPSPILKDIAKEEYEYFAVLAGAHIVFRLFFERLDTHPSWVEKQVQNTTTLEEAEKELTVH